MEQLSENESIVCHPPSSFTAMEKAGQLAAQVLDFLAPYVIPGVTTEELDTLAHKYILEKEAVPAPLNYHGFPKSICTSLNNVVCHGIPGSKALIEGDILNIDVTVIKESWYGDTSRMFAVGNVSKKAQRLMTVTYECLMKAIEAVKPGTTLGDIGHIIQSHAEAHGYSVVRDFCGHGIGQFFHGPPNVLHFGTPGSGLILKEGMFFTIEPMINAGKAGTKILDDGWTAVTRDGSLSAQYEHTLGVTSTGCQIFTLS